MDLDRAGLVGITSRQGPLFVTCHGCGHLRLSHREGADPPCMSSVSTMADVESWWRDPCPCAGYAPDDGHGRWTFDGRRMREHRAP
jgi:hypothetical protein